MPETDDPRIAAAAARMHAEGLARAVPLAPLCDAHVAALRANRPMRVERARRLLEKPLIRAAAMVACGEADAMVAGIAAPTRRVIEAALLGVGLAEGIALPSSFFLMLMPDGRALILADCAAVPDPDAEALSAIARASAASCAALIGPPRVAMLSYSTLNSGAGPPVDKMRRATALARAAGVDAIGPIQADAALNPAIAAAKGVALDGPANVLVFPDLDAGNIGYKLLQELAGAQAIGPFLQGFRRPVCDLSRGARVEDIVAASVVTLAMAAQPAA